MNALGQYLKTQLPQYHCSFTTGNCIHHCSLSAAARLHSHRFTRLLVFICKSLLGLVPSYLCVKATTSPAYTLSALHNIIQRFIPGVRAGPGQKLSKYSSLFPGIITEGAEMVPVGSFSHFTERSCVGQWSLNQCRLLASIQTVQQKYYSNFRNTHIFIHSPPRRLRNS